MAGGASALVEAGVALLGGHTVRDQETKYGLAVVGVAEPGELITLAGARPAQRLVLTKPLGTGVMINAYKFERLDEAGLEPALVEMERLNREAARLARAHGATAMTDVTGFGLAGHAWNLARESRVRLELRFDALPVQPGFFELVRAGVSTGCTPRNLAHAAPHVESRQALAPEQEELLYDPQREVFLDPGGVYPDLRLPSLGPRGGATALGRRALDVLRVEDGRPWDGPDIDEHNLLHETGLLDLFAAKSVVEEVTLVMAAGADAVTGAPMIGLA